MQLNQLHGILEELTYPLSVEELTAEFDGQTLDLPGGEEPIAAVIDRVGPDTIESADDAWHSMVASLCYRRIWLD